MISLDADINLIRLSGLEFARSLNNRRLPLYIVHCLVTIRLLNYCAQEVINISKFQFKKKRKL